MLTKQGRILYDLTMDSRIKSLDGKLLMAEDVARELRVSSARVRQLEKEGKLPAARTVGGTRIFCMSDVEKLAEERQK
jgi:hypothetical protein